MFNTTKFENVRAIADGRNQIKVEIEGRDLWIPKVQIHPDSPVQEAMDEGTLILNTSWAKKSKLIS